jgi:archaemetzincin
VDRIAVWWIGEGACDGEVMGDVRDQVERAFGVPVTVALHAERPTGTLDPARGQHLSSGILKWLMARRAERDGTIVGVTDADLFIPVLTFVFGEARLGGGVAVVSTARLGGERGARPDRRVLAARLAKESIHELGHAFGLVHCLSPRCVMARSASLVHVDAKGAALCHDCRLRLREVASQGGVGAHER